MTRLEKSLQKVLSVGNPYTPTVDPDGSERVEKERRKGVSRAWAKLRAGDAGLATAVQASAAEPPR
ncbi:MAG TPA: hypothetical protein VEY92_02280 [Pseudoxanthomonas sp.]|nr:hypothetical protein [Pseudoxanthomonas sp.]